MKAQGKETPAIIAIAHASWGHNTPAFSLKRLGEIFRNLATKGKKRTVYIEIDPELLNDYLRKEIDFKDAFYLSVKLAQKQGWNIVPLDRKLTTRITDDAAFPRKWPSLAERYLTYNLREKIWAKKVKELKPRESDLIILHPNHVRGFLLEAGMKSKKVIWVDNPTYDSKTDRRRLSSKERRTLKRRKAQKRKTPKPRK